MKKNIKGITLVALVITIIVLLILAGIAINLTVGNNGLFSRAQNVANTWRKAEVNEQEEMKNFENVYDNVLEGINSKDRKKEFYIELYEDETKTNLIEKLSFEFEDGMKFENWITSKYCVGLEEWDKITLLPGGYQAHTYEFYYEGYRYSGIGFLINDDSGYTGEDIITEGMILTAFKS